MSLLEYLPAIYQDPSDGDDPGSRAFIGNFLLAFEQTMLSRQDAARGTSADRPPVDFESLESLEDEIARIHLLFDPQSTPEAFLNWLASWVALTLRSDLGPARERRLLSNIARLYRIRGTRRYIEEVLKLYVDALPSVTDEDLPPLQIGTHSTVGADTYLGGGPAFLFQVKLAFSGKDNDFVARQRQIAHEVIELERPAHTWYELRVIFPRLRVGVHSTIGVDTVLAQ